MVQYKDGARTGVKRPILKKIFRLLAITKISAGRKSGLIPDKQTKQIQHDAIVVSACFSNMQILLDSVLQTALHYSEFIPGIYLVAAGPVLILNYYECKTSSCRPTQMLRLLCSAVSTVIQT